MERQGDGKRMKAFICKECGYADLSSSDSWKVIPPKDDIDAPAEIQCPRCGNGDFFIMQINITDMIKGTGKK